MKIFCYRFCVISIILYLCVCSYLYDPIWNTNECRSLESGSMVVPSKSSALPDSAFLYLPELPSLIDIQRKLNELEPNDPLKVDGRWGKLTCDKWDRVYCNEQAKKYFEGNENESQKTN